MTQISVIAFRSFLAPLLCGLALSCAAQSVQQEPEPAPQASPSTEAPLENRDAAKEQEENEESSESPGTFDDEPHSVAQKRKNRISMMETLETELLGLDNAFRPEHLSCSGAEPHRDAICSIAERICNLSSTPSLEAAQDCEKAKKSCSDAKKRYEQKCS